MTNLCPVCGYPDLHAPAYDSYGVPSYDICSSCGYQFGHTDDNSHISFEQWRRQWMASGMPWMAVGKSVPENWNPRRQLHNIGVKLS